MLEPLDLRRVVEHDVRVCRVPVGEVLMVFFRRVEGVELRQLRHDRALEDLLPGELIDVRARDPRLLVVRE